MERFGMSIQADGVRWEQRRKLRWNCAHAPGGNGDVTFRKHFEDKLKHSAGRFQLTIEKNAAKKRTEESMDKFLGETSGD